jgi:hypothetical protein
MKRLLLAWILGVVALAGCGSGASGATGTLDVVGGPSEHVSGGEAATLIVSGSGEAATRVPVMGGTAIRIALPPGSYSIAGEYGNAGCSTARIEITIGAWVSFQVLCHIR